MICLPDSSFSIPSSNLEQLEMWKKLFNDRHVLFFISLISSKVNEKLTAGCSIGITSIGSEQNLQPIDQWKLEEFNVCDW